MKSNDRGFSVRDIEIVTYTKSDGKYYRRVNSVTLNIEFDIARDWFIGKHFEYDNIYYEIYGCLELEGRHVMLLANESIFTYLVCDRHHYSLCRNSLGKGRRALKGLFF